ncbi:MAG: hypothetical protein KTR18_03680 [Acidiferrobacterales bacterium]|nr:hypothetical protein [Acidiferrobacterales bacterium]
MWHWYDNLSENTRIAFVGFSAVVLVGFVELKSVAPHLAQSDVEISSNVNKNHRPSTPSANDELNKALFEETAQSVRDIDPLFEILMRNGAFGALKNRLLNLAAEAVSQNQKDSLANTLVLLGQVSIEQQNLSAAEVYLFEALDILEPGKDDEIRTNIYVQLGRTYLKSRQIARDAGYAYDALQIGRTQLKQRRFDLAETNIRLAIDHSLSIHRYNAAASGYESLAHLYRTIGDVFQAEEAQLEAIRLYSSSGQTDMSLSLLEKAKNAGIDEWRLFDMEQQIATNRQTYEESISQIGTAKDYRRLYNYYLNQGDKQRAWHFRLLASQSLEEVSKRAMFHRQQGVLAILYNSNEAMSKAKRYFADASARFEETGDADGLIETNLMQSEVY